MFGLFGQPGGSSDVRYVDPDNDALVATHGGLLAVEGAPAATLRALRGSEAFRRAAEIAAPVFDTSFAPGRRGLSVINTQSMADTDARACNLVAVIAKAGSGPRTIMSRSRVGGGLAWELIIEPLGDAPEEPEEPTPEPTDVPVRVLPSAIAGSFGWSGTVLADIDESVLEPDGNTDSHASANGAVYYLDLDFPTPDAVDPLSTGADKQTFAIRMRHSIGAGSRVRLKVLEGSTVKQDLGTFTCTASQQTYRKSWDASILADATGAAVRIRIQLEDSLSSGFYQLEAVNWEAVITTA